MPAPELVDVDTSRTLLEGGIATRIYICLLFMAIGSLIVVWCYWVQSDFAHVTLLSPDTLICAETAKQLAHGHGFSSDFITPMGLAISPTLGRHPSLFCPPFPALALAPFIAVFGANNNSVMLCVLFWYLLQLVLLYWVADAWCGRTVSVLAGSFFLLNFVVLRYVLFDGAFVISMIPFSLLLLAVAWGTERGAVGCVMIGMAYGLCCLSAPPYIVLGIPVVVYLFIYSPQERGIALLSFAGGASMVAGPWLLRDWIVTGSPFWSVNWSPSLYDRALLHSYEGAGVTAGRSALLSFRGAWKNISGVSTVWGNLLGVVFLVAIIQPLGKPGFERLRYLVYAFIAALWFYLGWTPFSKSTRYYLPFLPFICLAVAMYMDALFKRHGSRSAGVIACFVGFVACVLLPCQPLTVDGVGGYGFSHGLYSAAYGGLTPDEVVASDIALNLAFYGGGKAVALNYILEDFLAMREGVAGIAGVYLSPDFKGEWIEADITEGWAEVLGIAEQGGLPSSVGFKKGYLLGGGDLILRD